MRDVLFEAGENILRAAKGYAAEVVLVHESFGLTRFARSRIHQSVDRASLHVGLRLRHGQRAAVVWWTRMDLEGILDGVRQARALLEHAPEDPFLPPLVPGRNEQSRAGFVEATAQATPSDRAEIVQQALEAAKGVEISGAVQTQVYTLALLNSENLRLFWETTGAALWVNAFAGEGGSGWAQETHPDIQALHPAAVAERAARKAQASIRPREVPPGDWPVILEPLALADLFSFLGWIGFSAQAVDEQYSCFLNRFDTQVLDPALIVVDDPGGTFPMPFDAEGIPKKPFPLVEGGVVRGPVFDLRLATKMNAVSTGHAMNFFGGFPYPAHVHVAPGNLNREELLSVFDRALLVTRFHYVNVTDPRTARLTGMTRDGTFLVEKGEIVAGVKNLRFHVSLLEIFQEIAGLSRDREVVGSLERYDITPPTGGAFPTIALPRFHFPSVTDF